MAKTIKAIVSTGKPETDQSFDVVQGSGAKNRPTRIKATKGARYQLEDPAAKNVGPENIRSKRVGKNLHVMLEGSNEADLIIEGYYDEANRTDDKLGLYGRAEDGKLYEYIPEDPSASGMPVNLADGGKPVSQVLGGGSVPDSFGLAGLPLAAVAGGFNVLTAGAAVVGAAALGGGGGGGGGGAAALTPAQQIQAAAQNNTASSGNLAASVYTTAGVTGVDSTNLSLVNGMLDTAAITNTSVDTTAKIQALVDAVKKVQGLANGTAGDGAASTLSATDITALGLGAVIDTAEDRTLFNNILDNTPATGADTAAEILALANIVDRIQKTAKVEAVSPALTAAELTQAGVVGVTDANLSAVLSSIAATSDGQSVDTLSELNNLVKDVNWKAATAPTTIAEATDGISADELNDGIQATMTVPAGATAGDTMTIVLSDTSTNPATVKSITPHVITAAEIAAGSFDVTMDKADAATDGTYSITTTTTRASDGLSTAASTTNFTVDLTAEVGVSAIAGNDVSASSTAVGEFNAVERGTSPTAVATPLTVSGTTDVEVGRTVTVRIHDINYTATVAAPATTGQANTWTVTLPDADTIALNHGNSYNVFVQTSDASGNTVTNNTHSLRINTASPDTPTIVELKTNDTTPTLTGGAKKIIDPAGSQTDPANFRNLEAGDLVDITVGGTTVNAVVGTNTNGFSYDTATGIWSLNTGNVSGFTALTNGDQNITVGVTAGGITKTDVSSNELHVNTTAPTLTLDPIAGDNRINGTEKDQGLNLTGTTNAEPGSTVSIELDGVTFTGTVLIGASGQPNTFSIPLTAGQVGTLAASQGAKVVTASVTNEFGAQQTITPAGGVLIDTSAPTAPTLTIAEAANGISAAELSDGVQVSAALPVGAAEGDVITFTVTDPSGDVRTVTHTVTSPEVTAGTAAVTIPANKLSENGSYSIAASTVDVAGNPGTAGTAVTFNLDTTAPGKNADGTNAAVPAPVITIAEAAGGITAAELADGSPAGIQTSVTLPTGSVAGDVITFTLTDPSGDVRTITYTVTNGDITAGSAAVTLPSSAVSEDGTYSLSVKTKDIAGNESAAGTTTFALNVAASIISAYAQDNGADLVANRAPLAADYTSLGVTGIGGANQPTVATINSALATAAIAGSNADTRSEVQAIVDAYQVILDNADTASTANPTQQQYAAIGVTGVDSAEKANLLGDVIDGKANADVDTANEVQALADKALATMAGTANATQMADIGVTTTNVTAENLKAIQNALAAATAANKDSLADVQGIVDAAITAYDAAANTIQNYAQDNGADLVTKPAPVIADYNALGVSGIGGSGQPSVATINSALASTVIAGAQADTKGEVQAIVDAYKTILDEANGATADANAQDPSAAQYAAIGVTGVDAGAEETLLGDVIGNKATADVDTVTKVQALADAVQAVMDGTAIKAQLESLGVTGVTDNNLAAVQAALAAATAGNKDTLSELQDVVNTAVNALDTIKTAAENNTATASSPSLTQYQAIGITGVTAGNLAAINSALNDADVQGAQADTKAEVQAIVDGFKAILDNADNAATTNPTQQNYTDIGVNGVDTAQEVTLLGDVIDGKASTDVDTVAKVQALANAVQAVMDGNATKAQLEALGVTGVTDNNLAAVQAALAAATDATQLNTLTGLQGVVTAAADALDAIKLAAENNSATASSPSLTQYQAIGITGVSAGNLAAINSALNDAYVQGANADTKAEVQAIVDGFKAILDNADTASTTNPTQQNYADIGVNGVDTANEVTLLGDVIDGKASTDVDTTAKVQALADAVQAVMDGTATKAQLETLGVTGVTDNNLAAVQAALAAATDATQLDTLAHLQAVVTGAVDALDAIKTAAENNSATAASPSLTQYQAIGITGVSAGNLAAINSALNDADVQGANADTKAEVQAIVDGFKAILDNADTASTTNPTQQNYADIGVNGVDTANEVTLLGDVIDGKASTDVDTTAKVQTLADAVQAVMDGTATKAQLESLGVTGVTTGNTAAVQAALAAATAGNKDSLSELQAVVDTVVNALGAIQQAAENNTAASSSLADTVFANAGVTGVDSTNLAAVQSALDSAAVNGAAADTVGEVQAIVTAANAIKSNADGTANNFATDPTIAQYAALGVTGVTTAAQEFLLGDVIDGKAYSAVDSTPEIQALANAATAVLNAALGGTAPTLAQLQSLGVTGVTAENLKAVQEAIAADGAANGTNGVDTLSGLQSVINTGIAAKAAAVTLIKDYAEGNTTGLVNDTGTPTAPTTATFATAGVTGVTSGNLAAIKDALASNAVNGAAADTTAEIQTLVDGYKDILAAADGTDANTTGAAVPSLADYQAIGITGATTDSAALLSDVIDGKATTDVDTVAEVQTLADAAKAAVTYTAANGQTAPTAAQINALLAGQTSGGAAVTVDNQAAVQAAIAAANANAPAIASQSELADVVKAAIDAQAVAIDKIADYAETGASAPAHTDYAAAGVTGVTAGNVAAINSAINAQAGSDIIVGNANDRAGADTTAKVQAIVDAYKDILAAADGNATDNSTGAAVPTLSDYQAIGITGADAASAALLSDVIDNKASTDVDTVAKVQTLADVANAVLAYDDPTTDTAPTKDQINALVSGQTVGGNPVPAVTDAALAQVQAAIDAANSDGTPLATQAEVAAVVKAAMDAYTAALDAIKAYAVNDSATAPTDTQYAAAGVIGVTSANVAAINSAINAQGGTDATPGATGTAAADDAAAVDTTAKVQAIVDAYQAILDEANGASADISAQDPTATQYAAIGVTGVDAGVEETLLGDVIGRKVTADVDTVAEVQTLADTVAKVIAAAAGGTAPTLTELGALGLTGVNAQNIAAVQAAIAASADNGSGVDTLSKLQALIASANDLPTGGVTITGTVKVGETLTASTTESGNVLADGDGLGTLSYKWFADGTEISGATARTYQLAAGDLGKVITAQVSYTDGGNTAESKTSAATAAVAAAATAGDAVIDLGTSGKLIAPVQVEGKWYYYWDRSGDGTTADSGSLNGGLDYTNHNVLDTVFKFDINGNERPSGLVDTNDVYRYATINGVQVALPTINGGIPLPNSIAPGGASQPGTAASGEGTTINPVYDDWLAIWDAFNGTGTTTGGTGLPSSWFQASYFTASLTGTSGNHAAMAIGGPVYDYPDTINNSVALEVVKANAAPVLDATASPALTVLQGSTAAPTNGQAVGSLVSSLVSGVSDSDAGAAKGIAITSVDNNGTLYYSTNGGTTWTAASGISDTNALLLAADNNTFIYYKPNSTSYAGGASAISFKAWDLTQHITEGVYADTSVSGGKSEFSTATDTIAISTATQVVNGDGSVTVGSTPNISGGSYLGWNLSDAGDVNGDGYDDVLLSEYANFGNSTRAYVVFGQSAPLSINVTAITTGGSAGFRIMGPTSGDTTFGSLSGIGDINGDGLADLAFGPTGGQTTTHVVYGKTSGSSVDLQSLGTQGFTLTADSSFPPGYTAGYMSEAGDVNGDGIGDFIMGYGPAIDSNSVNIGRAYVVFGKTDNTSVSLSTVVNGSNGFVIQGDGTFNQIGYQVSNAGDVNGDGLSDLLVSSRAGTGNSFVVFGKAGTTAVNVSALTTAGNGQGFIIRGESTSDYATQLSNVGDVNGDGLADFVVGAFYNDAGGSNAGRSYVVFGQTGDAPIDLSSLTSNSNTKGFVITGAGTDRYLGQSVSTAGDMNGDGLADLVVTASTATDIGRSYVVYGKTNGIAINMSELDAGQGGFRINGLTSTIQDQYATIVNAGDINGDGFDDLMLGARGWNGYAGGAYIIYGGTQYAAGNVDFVGDATANTQTGTTTAETFMAGDGNDTLVGGGGGDVMNGGRGNDTFVLNASNITALSSNLGAGGNTTQLAKVDGGTGYDTLRLAQGSGNLNLTTVTNVDAGAGDGTSRINSIERIDLATDTAANTLTIAARDVNDMAGFNQIRTGTVSADGNTWTNVSGTALSATTKFHQVVVDGDGSDVVNLAAGTGLWSNVGTVNNGSSDYVVWQNAGTNSQVLVKAGVTVNNLDTTPAGDAVIDLGTSGKLIAPVQVEGKWYYYWDRSGDGTSADTGSLNGTVDYVSHDTLDNIFKYDINGNLNPLAANGTSDVYRYATINGIQVAMSTANGGLPYPLGAGFYQSGTTASGQSTTNTNPVYDDLLAVWDASNGTGTTANVEGSHSSTWVSGVPANWRWGAYWSATAVAANLTSHIAVQLHNGGVTNTYSDADTSFVALEIVKANTAPVLDATASPTLSSVYANTQPTNGQVVGDLVSSWVGGISDADSGAAKGIAITGAAAGSTVWYSLNGGTTWASVAASALSSTNALLLAGDSDTRVYFQSASGATSVSDAITFRAWDQTQNITEGVFANTVTNGGKSQFSTATDTVGFTATPTLSPVTPTGATAPSGNSLTVGSAGDVNGDGFDDFMVGSYESAGVNYVVFGSSAGSSAIDFAAIKPGTGVGTGGFAITANGTSTDLTGYYLSSAGDINGDGLSDLFVTEGGSTENPSYVVYGKTSTEAVQLGQVSNGVNGFKITTSNSNWGNGQVAVTNVGDFNGDGIADLALNSPGSGSTNNNLNYIVFGRQGMTDVNLDNLVSNNQGVVFVGDRDQGNISVLGDVNGDGLADVLAGSVNANAAYVVFGRTGAATVNFTSLDAGVGGFKIGTTDATTNVGLGKAGAGVGDINGDGLADLIVGSANNDGRMYVVFGRTSTSNVTVDSVGAQGFLIKGVAGERYNVNLRYLSAAGDINGDGLGDFIIGSSDNDAVASNAGRAYVVFGQANNATVELSAVANGIGGFAINGSVAGDRLGTVVSAAGDLNGDGFDDLLVSGEDWPSISAYVVYGGTQYAAGNPVDFVGDATANTLTGSTAAETFVAGDGNDTLTGGGGADVMYAGRGNDTLVLNASNLTALGSNLGAGGNTTQLAKLDGGTGFDTLQLAQGAGNLDLTAISNSAGMTENGASRINSIERIDLGADTAANTLTIAARDVNDMAGFNQIHTGTASADGSTWTNVSGTALSATTQFHQVVVDGGNNDGVTLAAGNGFWFNAGQVSNDGGTTLFNVWQNTASKSQVIVKDGATVTNNDATPDALISLGSFGNLIAPVQVEGKWYYYWDRSGDGTSDNSGSLNGGNDYTTHNVLDGLFNQDINGVVNPGTNTTDTYRYATINGIKLALPTLNGGLALPNAEGAFQPGTSATTGGTSATYDDLFAVWDIASGVAVTNTTGLGGVPAGWNTSLWTATQGSGEFHALIRLHTGSYENVQDINSAFVALQVLPVVIDLNRDGILSYGQVTMDVNGDGALDLTKWAGAQDGVLVWDKYADGLVHDNSQYAFAQYATTYANGLDANGKAPTDLSGLAEAFDSNNDGVFSAADAQFAEFKVWQDANQNGVSDAGEVRGLLDWGILSINLSSDNTVRTPTAGVTEAGRTTATATDGSSVLVSDAAFEFHTAPTTVLKLDDVLQAQGAPAPANSNYGVYGSSLSDQLLIDQQMVLVNMH